MTTIQERVAAARKTLREAGIGPAEAEASARVLAQHALGWDAAQYLTSSDREEPPDFGARYLSMVARRARREPSAYITGQQEFWGLPLEVSTSVLIPRPETELIVQAVLELVALHAHDKPAGTSSGTGHHLDIADACTGSGNLAIALARELPGASIVATDISEDALEVARRNAVRHGVADRVRFACADVLHGVEGPFDVVVANPPYVRQGDKPGLQPEVRDHEPGVALYGGVVGTELMARVIEQSAERLRPGGWLVFEFGFGQEMIAESLIAATPPLALAGFRRDLQGLARTAIARAI
jgi:release factor glutamine methyltransferase